MGCAPSVDLAGLRPAFAVMATCRTPEALLEAALRVLLGAGARRAAAFRTDGARAVRVAGEGGPAELAVSVAEVAATGVLPIPVGDAAWAAEAGLGLLVAVACPGTGAPCA